MALYWLLAALAGASLLRPVPVAALSATPTPLVGCCHCQDCAAAPAPVCLDLIGAKACSAYCGQPALGCLSVGYSTEQTCEGGCALNAAISPTPSPSPTDTPIPTATPPPTSTATPTATPPICCQCPGPACTSYFSGCPSQCVAMVGEVCFGGSGRCVTPTPADTHTPTTSPSATRTPTPTAATATATPTFYVDHYKCYVADGPNREISVHLADRFEADKGYRVLTRDTSFCTPVRRDGSRIAAPDNFLTCYELRPSAGEGGFENARVNVQSDLYPNPADQISSLDARRPDRLCVPSRVRP